MAKPSTGSSSSLVKIVVIGGVVFGAAWLLTGSGDTPAAKKTSPSTAAKVSAPGDESYTSADRTASYAPLNVAAKDSFRPLVMKAGPGQGPDSGNIGIDLAGEGGWSYTGKVEINGKPEAVLENPTLDESVFVSVGERWKKAKIRSISDFQIVMVKDSGVATSIKMGEPASAKAPIDTTLPPASIQPPAMQGAIGPMQVTPNVQINAQPSGRGGRRNRGNVAPVTTDNGN